MRLLKRTLSAFLAFVMVFTMLPLQVWASETQQSANDSVNFGSIVADGADDDRALEEVGNDVDTYIFKIEGVSEPVSTQYVKNGEEVYAPEAPAKEGYKFVGWFEGKTQFVAGPAKVDEGNMRHTYTAVYEQVYYVFFMDGIGENAAVVHTEEGETGAVIKTTDVTFPMEQGQGISGWYRNAELSDAPVAEVTIADQNITLYPKVEKGCWISFDTVGADPIAPVFVAPGKTAEKPADPVKTGFTFKGWKPEGGEDFDFAKPLIADVKLVAQWEGNDNTPYKVFYWVENADDNEYSLVNSETLTGKAGDKAVNGNLELHIPAEYPDQTLAKAVTFNADKTGKDGEKTIAGDGSTIVNVYYDRNVYTIMFRDQNGKAVKTLTCKKEEHTHGLECILGCNKEVHTHTDRNGCYGDEIADIKAKYGAKIKWPKTSKGHNHWYTERFGSTGQSNIQTMPYGDRTFYDYKNDYTKTSSAEYYVEKLGEKGKYQWSHTDTITGTASITDDDKYDIPGFTFLKVTNDWGEETSHYGGANFYYTRNDYTLKLVNGRGQEKDITLQYEAPLAGKLVEPERPAGMPENYKFKGWYLDENFTNEFKYNEETTMPANNLTLYALWAAQEITVTAYDKMASENPKPYEIKVSYNGTIDQKQLPTIDKDRVGFQFVGWATYENGVYTPFNLNTPLAEDITIYPYWISTKTFKVSYDLSGADGEVKDTKIYRDGAFADVQPLPDGFTNPNGKVFLGWKANREGDKNIYQPGDKIQIQNADVILKAQWGNVAQKTTLTYHPGYDGANSVEEHWANNEMVTLKTPDDLGFTRDGFEFLGWATSAGSEVVYRAGDTIRVNTKNANTDNHLYAVWKENFKQGDPIKVRVVKDGEEVNASEYVDVIQVSGTESLTISGGNPTYTLGYTYKDLNCADFNLSVTVPEGYSVAVTADKPGPTGDAVRKIEGEGASWTLDNIPGGATVTVSLNAQKFTVKYEVSPAEGGMVFRDNETVHYGETAQGSTATPNEGYYFVEWRNAQGQQVSTNATFAPENVTADATYTAVFAQQKKITVKAKDLSKEYDGTAIEADSAQLETIAGELDEGHQLIVTTTVSKEVINVWDVDGKHQIATCKIVDGAGNDVTERYRVTTQEGTLSITPKPVTITVNNGEKQYGEPDPTFTGTVGELVKEGDLGEVTFTRTNAEEDVKLYPEVLDAEYEKNDNYSVTVKKGNFEIKQNTTAKVVVTIVGRFDDTKIYTGSEQVVTGYDVGTITIDDKATTLYTSNDFSLKSGVEVKVSGTDVNTYTMGLTADSFQNNSKNFTNVEFEVTDGYLKINPAEVTVTITGNQETKTYNGSEQSVATGYTATPSNAQYNTEKITFSGNQTVAGTNHATYPMGLMNNQFSNTDTNYSVTFNVVQDGSLTINKLPVTVTAKDINVSYGEPVGNLTATKSAAGGVAIPADFDSVVTYGLAHDGGETPNVGEYPIYFQNGDQEIKETVTDKDSYQNYEVTFVPGTLTVTDENVPAETVVKKTHEHKTYGEGDTITYTITVKNIYNEVKTLTVKEQNGVKITSEIPKTLEPGKSVTLTATYTVRKEDMVNGSFKNTVTVKLGDKDFQDEDTVTFTADPKLTVEKTIVEPKDAYGLNDTIHYQIKVTNSGNVTLENITLSDVLDNGEKLDAELTEGSAETLAPGASVTYTASYTVEEADLGKTIVNTATATGSYAGETVTDDGQATANTVLPNRKLAVQKRITNGDENKRFALGETIAYEIVVTNSGNVTLTGIDVTDSLVALENATNLTLKPNETVTFTPTYQVTMGDVLEGVVYNKATATAPENLVISDDATATITGLDSLRAEVVLNSESHTYDGKDHNAAGGKLTVMLGNAVQNGFEVKFAEGTAAVTGKDVLYNEKGEVAGYPVTADAGDVTIWYAGEDFTNKFVGKINITEGALTILPKAVKVTAVDQGPVEYGTLVSELPNLTIDEEALQAQLAECDTTDCITYTLAYDETNFKDEKPLVGKHTIKFVDPDEEQGNYKVTFVPGTLTVTAPETFDYVQKDANNGKFAIGEEVTFTITVTNIYDVDATVQLNEQKDMTITGVDSEGKAEIPAGETREFDVSYLVTKADVEAGEIKNKVTWTLTPHDEDVPPVKGDDESIIKNESYLVWYVLEGDTEGCTNDMPEQTSYKYGTTVTVWMPELAEGYKFSGWTVEGAAIENGMFSMPENAVILTGTISKEQVKVTYSAEEGGLVTDPKSGLTSKSFVETLSYGANAQGAVAVANEGYTFLGWKLGTEFVEQDEVIAPTEVKESVTYTAVFAKNYTVTYQVEGETEAYATQTHYAGEAGVEVLSGYPEKVGYDFSGWTTANATVADGKFTMPEQDVLFTGSYTAHTNLVWYVLEGDTEGCANIGEMPKQANYAYDTVMTVWMPELAEGYKFSGWTVEGAAIENGVFSMPDNAVILRGTISKEQVKVDYKAQEGGLITDSNGLSYADLAEMVPYGENAKGATASAKMGYTFVEWQDANHKQVSTDPEFIPTNVTAPATYYAVFAKQKVKVEYTADVGGFITSPSGATFGSVIEQVTYGEDAVGAMASAKPGYYFVHWLDAEGNEVGTELHFAPENVTEEAVYKAVFAEQTAIEVKAEDLRKEYDGTAIEANDKYTTNTTLKDGHKLVVTTKVSKEVINVTDTDGKHQIESIRILDANDKDVTGQYQVSKADGLLTILPKPISIEVADGVKTYGETELEIIITADGLVNENDLGEITYERSSKSENAGIYTDELWPVYTPNRNYTVTEMPGTLTINKRKVALESESGEQVYNGKALTKPDVKIGDVKFVEGDAEVNAIGTQTLVGESKNTIEITWADKTVEGNYEIVKTEGTLTVTAPKNLDEYVVKTHEGQNFKVGDTVTFKITVTNIYDVKAAVTLEEMAGMAFENGQTTLEDVLDPGQTKTYTATRILTEQDFEDGGVRNTVSVTLVPDGKDSIEGGDDDEVKLEEKPDMSVDKTVVNPQDSYRVGDTIRYQITVTNTGNVPLHDLELTDVMNADGKVTFPAGTALTRELLNIGETWTVTCSYVVRDADEGKTISNTAKVISRDDDGNPNKDGEDTTPGESVQKRYSLTIHYRNAAGNAVADSYSARYHVGDSFKIVSPIVAGYYDPQIRSISSGANGMPAQDLEYVVSYTAIPVPAPDPGPGPAPNPGPDDGDDDDDTPPAPVEPEEPGDYEVDPDNYTLTEVEDNETPLANLNLDGHTCCILHLLLMLAAMVVLGFDTKSRKKHQARIFELKKMLAMEEDHSDDPEQP